MANIEEIEEKVTELCETGNFGTEFIYDLLLAYGKPQASINRLKNGNLNQAKDPKEVLWKKTIYYRHEPAGSLRIFVDSFKDNEALQKMNIRFVIASDGLDLVSLDTKTNETLDISLKDLPRHFAFFLPLAGMEKSQAKVENIADRKAAEKMAKLYDEIQKSNHLEDKEALHSLNVFFSRLLFCFFAEDTDVFQKSQFVNSIASHTQEDGSDLNVYLDRLFEAFDEEDKSAFPEYIRAFPYVNGGLFSRRLKAPTFTTKARQLIIDCGELNWSQINPDIFGSMMQAVVHHSDRASLGMHYTSVTNIMKVIDPLFMDELLEEFEKAFDSEKKLEKLWDRIAKIKIFDPACGSGNFLIIAYKEFRKLEHKIIARMQELELKNKEHESGVAQAMFLESKIKLESFYGVEIEEFAKEIAVLSLWIAKHQMNIEFRELFGPEIPLVPLKDAGNIACANAARINWNEVCKNDGETEIYLIGNPPYCGPRNQLFDQKEDMRTALSSLKSFSSLDYICIWFFKGAQYIENSKARLAFVSTNSVSQGRHLGILWEKLLDNLEIGFAWSSFKWANHAKKNAGVTVVIIELQNKTSGKKRLISQGFYTEVDFINPNIAGGARPSVINRSKPLGDLPKMNCGNYTGGCNSLYLSAAEASELILSRPHAKKFIKRLMGSREIIRGEERYCIWIDDEDLTEALEIEEIRTRVEEVRVTRNSSRDKGMRKLAERPHQFRDRNVSNANSVVVPIISSEKYQYLIGILPGENVIITNLASVAYEGSLWLFGLLISRMHMVWMRAVAGRLKTDYRYSSALVYNNFPVRPLSDEQKKLVTEGALRVLAIREKYPEKTLAQLYDPDKMPAGLKVAHEELDEIVDSLYSAKGFANDEERLSLMFDLYEKMIAEENGELHA